MDTVGQRRRRFTVAEYCRLAEAGILHEDDRVELLDGDIIPMTPIGPAHASCVVRLTALLRALEPTVALVGVQNPFRLSDISQPQPDFAVLRPRADFYKDRLATPADVVLLIEVAESSLTRDKQVKIPLYARAGIAEVWLLDLNRDTLTIYRQPGAGTYRQVLHPQKEDAISPVGLPEVSWTIRDLLG